jgi:hypothetical protein
LARRLAHVARALDRRKPGMFLDHGGEFWVGVAVKIEKAHGGVVARRQDALWRP